uniref:EF-hand domain-containing protein n=1 Tax=Chelonoidis abingdonii TaxID=106734 RepID=A0A8C0GNY5_CHEAB
MFLVKNFLGGGGGGGSGGGGFGGNIGNVIGGFLSGGGGGGRAGGGGGAGGAMGIIGGVINAIRFPPRSHFSNVEANESEEVRQFRRLFTQLAGDDMEVSASELMNILNKVVTRHPDLKTDGFGIDTCRSMVAVMDVSSSQTDLGFEEFKYLWGNIQKWQCVYKQYDTDRSGTIGSSELPGAFEAAGFRLNEQLYQMIVRRYSDENGHMDFDNFISCLVRLDAMFRAFKSLDKDGDGQIRVNIQEVSEAGGWLPPPVFSFLLSSKGP